MTSSRYYCSTRIAPLPSVLRGLVWGCGVAFLAGGMYGVVGQLNPLKTLNMVGTLFVAVLVGKTVRKQLFVGRVRDRRVDCLVAGIAACVALYAAWSMHLAITHKLDSILLTPLELARGIGQLAENIHVQESNNGAAVWMLAAMWIVEAVAMLVLSISPAFFEEIPFCEPCNRWTRTSIDNLPVPLFDPQTLREDLEAERYEPLINSICEPDVTKDHTQVTVMVCPQCSASNFLKVLLRQTTPDQKRVKYTSVVRWLKLDQATMDAILKRIQEVVPPEDEVVVDETIAKSAVVSDASPEGSVASADDPRNEAVEGR